MGYLYLVFFFVVGAAVGSFVNAAVYRLHAKLPLVNARSLCPHCQHRLAARDLVPVVSWLVLRGRCRYCGQPISYHYPTVELVTGLLFAASFAYNIGLTRLSHNPIDVLALVAQLVFITILMIIFWYDLKFMAIPNRVVVPGMVAALAFDLAQIGLNLYQFKQVTAALPIGGYLLNDTNFLTNHLLDIATPYAYGLLAGILLGLVFFVIVWLTQERAMGGGDVKLAVLLGLILPWPYLIPALYLAFLIGSVVGVGLILTRRKKMRTLIPLAPFLVTGTLAAMFFGPQLVLWMITIKPF